MATPASRNLFVPNEVGKGSRQQIFNCTCLFSDILQKVFSTLGKIGLILLMRKSKITINDDHKFFYRAPAGTYLHSEGKCTDKPIDCHNIRSMYYCGDEVRFDSDTPVTRYTRQWLKPLRKKFKRDLLVSTPVGSVMCDRLYRLLLKIKKWPKDFDCREFVIYMAWEDENVKPGTRIALKHVTLPKSPPPGSVIGYWAGEDLVHWGIQWTHKWVLSKLGTVGSLCFNTHDELIQAYNSDHQTLCCYLSKSCK